MMSRHTTFRISAELLGRIQQAADRNSVLVGEEIRRRLEATFLADEADPAWIKRAQFNLLKKQLGE